MGRFLALLSLGVFLHSAPVFSANWNFENIQYSVPSLGKGKTVNIRAGHLKAKRTFRGNILYLEGLGDSMMNHDAFFEVLTESGFRVIAFDYMGQGGAKGVGRKPPNVQRSGGSMDNTRLISEKAPDLEIASLAKAVWAVHRNPDSDERILLGWSTGGLAAYILGSRGWADALILIAPGICPKKIVGEGLLLWNKISLRTLTRSIRLYNRNVDPEIFHPLFREKSLSGRYYPDPHVEGIRPESPLDIPGFGLNIMTSSSKVRGLGEKKPMTVHPAIPGLMTLGGADYYVDSNCARNFVKKYNAHFKIVEFPGAYHEHHNELPEVQSKLIIEVLDFLNRL